MIEVGRVKFRKPIAIILNPTSGKRREVDEIIARAFTKERVPFEFFETKKYQDGIRIAETIDIDQYEALVAVGGDGSLHEIINGLKRRQDKKVLPVACIPNGTGNDYCCSLGIYDIETAIADIIKGDTIRLDLGRVMIDHEAEEAIPEYKKLDMLRYSIINTSFSMPAKFAAAASSYKAIFGKYAYQAGTLRKLPGIEYDKFSIQIDGEAMTSSLETLCLFIFNSKYGGGNQIINSFGLMNDGQAELSVIKTDNITQALPILTKISCRRGTHAYNPRFETHRARSLRITNLNLDEKG